MTDKELKNLISKIWAFRAEFQTIEAKRAESGAPDGLYDDLRWICLEKRIVTI